MKKSANELWKKFRKQVPGKVQISILLVSIAVGIALWGGWLKLDTDHFVIEAAVALALFVYAVFVALEAGDHLDRLELLGVMLSYAMFNFYVTYEVTNENVALPVIGEMRHAIPDLVQLGQWMVVVGVIGLIFNLVVDRDTALSNLAWHWRNNPLVWMLRPIPRDFAPIIERWQKRLQGLSLPERPQLRRQQTAEKRSGGRRPEQRVEREASSSE